MHKVYLLSVQSSGSGYRVAGREWDVVTRQLGEIAFQSAAERDAIPEALLAVLHGVFRPIAAIETSKLGGVTLRARGGEYPPPDESWQPLPKGRVFEVYYCFLNKEREIERVQQVPFTYVAPAEETGRGMARGSVTSGLRAPLTSRRRIQPVALGINQRRAETRLTLITRPPVQAPGGGRGRNLSPADAPGGRPEEGRRGGWEEGRNGRESGTGIGRGATRRAAETSAAGRRPQWCGAPSPAALPTESRCGFS